MYRVSVYQNHKPSRITYIYIARNHFLLSPLDGTARLPRRTQQVLLHSGQRSRCTVQCYFPSPVHSVLACGVSASRLSRSQDRAIFSATRGGVGTLTPDTWAEKFESFERINSIRETNESFDSCNSCKRLGTSRLHELHVIQKFPFVSRIEFIRSKLSNFSAHVYGVRTGRCCPTNPPRRTGQGRGLTRGPSPPTADRPCATACCIIGISRVSWLSTGASGWLWRMSAPHFGEVNKHCSAHQAVRGSHWMHWQRSGA